MERENNKNFYSIIGFLCISSIRKELFQAIAKGDKFPNQLQKILDKPFSTISTNLKELCEKKIIECRNPENKIGRIYTLSESARNVESQIKNWIQMNNKGDIL